MCFCCFFSVCFVELVHKRCSTAISWVLGQPWTHSRPDGRLTPCSVEFLVQFQVATRCPLFMQSVCNLFQNSTNIQGIKVNSDARSDVRQGLSTPGRGWRKWVGVMPSMFMQTNMDTQTAGPWTKIISATIVFVARPHPSNGLHAPPALAATTTKPPQEWRQSWLLFCSQLGS